MYSSSGLVSRVPQTTSVSTHFDPMAAKDPEVIDIPDEGDDDGDNWQDVGSINVKEAAAYKEKVNEVFEIMSLMITNDHKDAIHAMITAFKKLVAKHWEAMKDADIDMVVRF